MIDTLETTSPALVIEHIDADHLDRALAAVEKVNRRAARAGIEQRLEVVTSTALVPDTDAAELLGLPGATRELVTFVVLGQPLVIAGWEFVATLSFDAEAGVVTRPVPGATAVDLAAFRTSTVPTCDACKTARRRTDTYVLRSEDGALTVVGRNCLAAFIGLDPSAALRFVGDVADKLGEELDGWGSVGRVEYRWPAETVLAVASAAIAAFGWVPARSYDGVATVARVGDVLYPLPSDRKAREAAERTRAAVEAKLDEAGGPSRALERAGEVLAWVRAGEVGTGEYAANLQAVLSAPTVGQRNLGLAVSAVSAWAKAQDRAIEQAARRQRAASSDFVGAVGEKLELNVELVQQPRFIDGAYGVSTLLVFADEAGNVFKWFASGSRDLAVGTRFTGKATVKKHETYNDSKSTVITRFSFKEV